MERNKVYVLMFLIYLCGFLVYDAYDYYQNEKSVYDNIQKQLEMTVKDASILIDDEYIANINLLTKDRYLQTARMLTKINNNHQTAYVYAFLKKDENVVFVATSYKDNEWNKAYDSDFLKPYKEASLSLKNAFTDKKPFFEFASDEWGKFQSMLIPYTTKSGTVYIIGADIEISHINSILRSIFIKNIIIGLYFLLILAPIIWLFTLVVKKQKESLKTEIQQRTNEIQKMTVIQNIHIERLTRVATALSNESHMPVLLEMILDGAKDLTGSDGGTLYLKSPDGKSLNFHVVKTKSLGISMGGTHGEITWPSLPLFLEDGSPNKAMVAALCAVSGELINIPDVYEADGFNFEGTKRFDKANSFRSKSMLVIPLKNHEDEIIGVLQLINKIDQDGEVVTFCEADKTTSLSLASQAAMAITNRLLIKGLEDLLMAFIESIAKAIDAKSPYTGGHVRKVAEIARDLAKGVSDDNAKFPHVKFSEEELKQIHIAGLMHDIGKISTPVHIVDKSTKLEAIFDRIEYVVLKCELLKCQQPELSDELDDDIRFLREINNGGEFMAEPLIERVKKIASKKVVISGVEQELLSENEVYNLSIKKGTLTKEDRDVINYHAILSLKMLETLPFPKKLARIPEIAGNHHEQICGKGYPRGLKGDELSLESRIMAIADIFEALSASDRPYKDGKKLSECFKILEFMAKDNEIDTDLLKFYYESGLYMKYARENLKDYQIDEVNKLNI